MKTTITACILALIAHAALAAPPPKPVSKDSGGMSMACCKKCPMCQAKMAGGKGKAGGGHTTAGKPGMLGKSGMGMMAGKPGMGGMMGGMGAPPPAAGGVAITVTPDGNTYVVRGDMLYRFDADLKLTAQARLGNPAPNALPAPPAGGEHGSHHKP